MTSADTAAGSVRALAQKHVAIAAAAAYRMTQSPTVRAMCDNSSDIIGWARLLAVNGENTYGYHIALRHVMSSNARHRFEPRTMRRLLSGKYLRTHMMIMPMFRDM